ncbi:MAG: hypothetical protein F7C81_02620 [Desulfurococcales archaeon]|nr:hypothetical protein [Desulfurococcales archaeon]
MRLKVERVIVIVLFTMGSVLRILFTPYSTGSDIPQFYGFARSFSSSPFCIYMHETGSGEEWPYSWLYLYGPVLAMILYIVYRLVNDSRNLVDWWWEGDRYVVVVDMMWIISLKTVFIAGDLFSAYILYRMFRSARPVKRALLAGLYYASPIVLYTSSIYGMFDSIALMFMLASLALANRPLASGLLAGTAVMTKQTMLFPALFAGLALALSSNYRRLYWYIIGMLMSVSLPLAFLLILCPESSPGVMLALKQQSLVYYPRPLVYNMNGLSSIATYLNEEYGYDTLTVIKSWPLILGVLIVVMLVAALKFGRLRDPVIAASIAYIVFISSYWRVNPQYLAPLIAFLLLLLFKCSSIRNRNLNTVIIVSFIIANLWPLMYPIDFWFHVHIEQPNDAVRAVVKLLSLEIYNKIIYTAYSLSLTASLITTIIYTLYRCR